MAAKQGSRLSKKAQLDFYNFDQLWSRNGVYNFLVGARGLGKTYGAKEQAIRNFIRNGERFIYLRRYDTELSVAKHTLFNDMHEAFPEWDFKAKGDDLYMRQFEDEQWKVCGHAIALSKAQQKKSVNYHDVTMIIYDEFIIERGAFHYLPSEARVFNDFYSTVDRYRDKTRVLFLANAISIMNPYFLEYKIEPRHGTEWMRKYKGFIVCHFPDSAQFSKGVYKTRFGQFINGTEYAAYAVGSEFADNDASFVADKSPEAMYWFTLVTQNGSMSVWYDMDANPNQVYITSKPPKEPDEVVLDPRLMKEGRSLIELRDPFLARVRSAFSTGNAWFDSPTTRNVFAEIYNRR